MAQKTGALIFDETADRYDIRFDLNDYYGGLHCGDALKCCTRQMEADPHGVRGQLVSCWCEGFGFERAAGAYLKAA